MVVRRGLALPLTLLALAGCSAGGHPGSQRASGPPLVVPEPSHSPAGRPPPARPGTVCGQVTTLAGTTARVVVVKGRTTCATALRVFHTYYDPSTPAEGGAGLAVVDHWTCETRRTVTTCVLKATTIQARA